MIDENRYEWEVYYNGVLLGRTNTEGRHQLIQEKVEPPIAMPSIEFKLVLKQAGVEDSNLHTCPYAEEIHGDYETLCDCDEESTRQCAMDV
jgi:hypothetical protein